MKNNLLEFQSTYQLNL